jgi:hypothetical protein
MSVTGHSKQDRGKELGSDCFVRRSSPNASGPLRRSYLRGECCQWRLEGAGERHPRQRSRYNRHILNAN